MRAGFCDGTITPNKVKTDVEGQCIICKRKEQESGEVVPGSVGYI